MAEAEETSNTSRFFCHKCSEEINPKLPEYVCPICNSGFIEPVERPVDSDSDSSDMDVDVLEFLPHSPSSQPSSTESSGSSSGTSSSGPRRSPRYRNLINPRYNRRRLGQGQDRHQATGHSLQTVLMQMTSNILGGSELGGVFADGFEFPVAGMPLFVTSLGGGEMGANLASNPGDYAWGRGGLDAIITQLMNQLDGTGPPPLPQEKIDQIPTVKITKEQCDKNLQCTVCMEDYKLDEGVRKLNCEHCYHDDCIIPWLQLHGTCPVCRKPVLSEYNEDRPRSSMRAGTSDSPLRHFMAPPGNASNDRPSNNSSSNPSLTEEDLD